MICSVMIDLLNVDCVWLEKPHKKLSKTNCEAVEPNVLSDSGLRWATKFMRDQHFFVLLVVRVVDPLKQDNHKEL